MALFHFGKKKEQTSCCCNGSCPAEPVVKSEDQNAQDASIKILGSGCAKCNQLEAATKTALTQLGMDTTVDHVSDFSQISAYGVMTTPALVVNEKVVSHGKVLKPEEIVTLLQKTEK